jgi:uncharacterized membrane protein
MKKLFVYLVLLCVLVGLAAAQLAVQDVQLGSDSQTKSNTKNDNFYQYAENTFTVTNNGNATVTSVALTSNANSKYNVTFSPSIISSLPAHASTTVSIRAIVPEDLSTFFTSRSSPETDRNNVIGNIIASYSGGSSQSTIRMEAKNELQLDRIYVQINDQSQKSYKDGDEVKDISPGDKLIVQVKVKNRYSSGDDVDLNDVQVDLASDNSDFDIDDTLDFSDISSGKDKTKTLTYTVDSSIDEDTYTVTFTLTGQDDYNSNQGQQWKIDFRVQKIDENIQIRSATLSPDTLKCDTDTSMTVRVENTGSSDSDQIVLIWENAALGLTDHKLGINLNSGDTQTVSIPISVPKDQRAGTYSIKLMTYFDYTEFQNQNINNFATVDLKVQDCMSTITCYSCFNGQVEMNQYQAASCPAGESLTIPKCQVATPQQNVTVVTQPPVTTTVQPTVPAQVTYTPTSQTNWTYIGLIGLGYVFVIIIGVALIAYAVKRR